jgi:hypothetical protein
MPAFSTLLKRVAEYYREQRNELRAQNDSLMTVFGELTPAPVDDTVQLTRAPLDSAREQLDATFDKRYGGFGNAPKFPHPGSIDRLMHHWHSTAVTQEPDLHALFMSATTLRATPAGRGVVSALIAERGDPEVDRVCHELREMHRAPARRVLEHARQRGELPREADLDLFDAATADEIFMTSTSLCICPVRSIGGRPLPEIELLGAGIAGAIRHKRIEGAMRHQSEDRALP